MQSARLLAPLRLEVGRPLYNLIDEADRLAREARLEQRLILAVVLAEVELVLVAVTTKPMAVVMDKGSVPSVEDARR